MITVGELISQPPTTPIGIPRVRLAGRLARSVAERTEAAKGKDQYLACSKWIVTHNWEYSIYIHMYIDIYLYIYINIYVHMYIYLTRDILGYKT